MNLQITTTDKLSIEHGIKCLIYGRAGTGKTWLCGTAPRPLIISAESGILTLRNKAVPVTVVNNLKDVEDAYAWLTTSPQAAYIDTVCLDSLSEIAEVCLAAAKRATKDGRKAYGEMADNMLPMIKAFRDLPGKHVVMTCKEGYLRDETTGLMRFGPTCPGQQLPKDLPYLFDEVFNTGVGAGTDGTRFHYLRTAPDMQYEAKDRSGMLDDIEYPDLTHVFRKVDT